MTEVIQGKSSPCESSKLLQNTGVAWRKESEMSDVPEFTGTQWLKKQEPSFDSKVKLLGFRESSSSILPNYHSTRLIHRAFQRCRTVWNPEVNDKHFHGVLLYGNNSIHKEKTGDLKHTGSGGPKVDLNETATEVYLPSLG